MFVNAPMGVMQQVQPLPTPPSLTPQVAPAAQRELASAVSGSVPVLTANPDRKQSPQTQTPKATPATPSPVTPETWLLQETVTDEAPGETTFRLLNDTSSRSISRMDNAGFATQLLAQEDMAEVTLPQTPNVADMLKRLTESRTSAAQASPVSVQERAGTAALAMLAVPASSLNTVVRRDTYGSVLMPRTGATAYLQAQQRLVKPETPIPAGEEDYTIEQTEAA